MKCPLGMCERFRELFSVDADEAKRASGSSSVVCREHCTTPPQLTPKALGSPHYCSEEEGAEWVITSTECLGEETAL